MGQITVFSGVERRRRLDDDENPVMVEASWRLADRWQGSHENGMLRRR